MVHRAIHWVFVTPFIPFINSIWRIIPGLEDVVNNHGDRLSPLRMGLWDPFQMAELHGLQMG